MLTDCKVVRLEFEFVATSMLPSSLNTSTLASDIPNVYKKPLNLACDFLYQITESL